MLNDEGRDTKLLLADQLSLGMAPKTVCNLLREVRKAVHRGLGVHEVEFSGTGEEARGNIQQIQAACLRSSDLPVTTRTASEFDSPPISVRACVQPFSN
ncbi:hypothetical protein ACIRQH_37935 [Streptomyces sp. NPDC102279]|uniref:hypothetical protein n=1 Tax=Streptomyces sp. NPDC102279 TaxID=3366153 RepID=UPI0038297539